MYYKMSLYEARRGPLERGRRGDKGRPGRRPRAKCGTKPGRARAKRLQRIAFIFPACPRDVSARLRPLSRHRFARGDSRVRARQTSSPSPLLALSQMCHLAFFLTEKSELLVLRASRGAYADRAFHSMALSPACRARLLSFCLSRISYASLFTRRPLPPPFIIFPPPKHLRRATLVAGTREQVDLRRPFETSRH